MFLSKPLLKFLLSFKNCVPSFPYLHAKLFIFSCQAFHIFMPSFARTPAILSLSLFFLSSTSPFILPSPTVSSLEKYVVLNFYPHHPPTPPTHLSLPNTYFANSSPLLSGSSGPRLKFGLNFKQWTTPLIKMAFNRTTGRSVNL